MLGVRVNGRGLDQCATAHGRAFSSLVIIIVIISRLAPVPLVGCSDLGAGLMEGLSD